MTAFEIRISDWRSDVCSSDLLSGCAQALYEQPFVPIATLPTPGERLVSWGLGVRSPSGSTPLRSAVAGTLTFFERHLTQNTGPKGVAWKSVVSGQSVLVVVVLVGRSVFKKKKQLKKQF